MCSIGEDDFGDEGGVHAMIPTAITDNTSSPLPSGTCNKCGKQGSVYKLNFREPECRDCFLAYTRHKFRAALGASKVLPRDAKVLLIIDGSKESLVLLDMLHYAQTQNTFKRLHCSVQVLYIDESELTYFYSDSLLKQLALRYEQFSFFVLPVDVDVAQLPIALKKLDDYKPANTQRLKIKLDKLHSLTSRQDYLMQLSKNLIGHVALALGCGYVFVPAVSTTLAAQLLTSIVVGRGGSAACDVALLDERLIDGVKLLRPLKDLNEAEVQLYIHAQNLEQLILNNLHPYGFDAGDSASLQNLSQAFITNLQANFAGTVSTVFRTGNKIAPDLYLKEINDVCNFCHSNLDYANSSTLLAIELSRVVSDSIAETLNSQELEQEAIRQLNAKHDKRLRKLCHACRNIQNELTDKHEFLL